MKIELLMDPNLSNNLSYKEAVQSRTATINRIDNTPTFEQLIVMKYLAVNFFQVLRNEFDVLLKVNSFFRCKQLNIAAGGAETSDHMIELDVAAIDIDDTYCQYLGVYNRHLFRYIFMNMDYYKLIWEYEDELTPKGQPSPRWIHISFSTDSKKNKQKITLFTNGDGYVKFDREKVKL